MQAWHFRWAVEALRVLKPGGHLLAFGGTRTSHRLVCALEDAGFEIRCSLAWVYGSGFSKVGMIDKRIDKALRGVPQGGADPLSLLHGKWKTQRTEGKRDSGDRGQSFGAGLSQYTHELVPNYVPRDLPDVARRWSGWAGSLRPAHEPIIVARKPLDGNAVENLLEHGTGQLHIDACRTGYTDEADRAAATPGGRITSNARPGVPNLDGAERTDVSAHDTSKGRWPTNLLLECTCPDGPVPGDPDPPVVRADESSQETRYTAEGGTNFAAKPGARRKAVRGPVHTDPACPCAILDAQAGARTSGRMQAGQRRKASQGAGGYGGGFPDEATAADTPGDSGGVSRYFPVFYASKAKKSERWAFCHDCGTALPSPIIVRDHGHGHGGEAGQQTRGHVTYHPTVKPVALMRWLVRLVTPPGGTVLDPFAGTGTTGVACAAEGFRCVLVEQDATYYEIAKSRLSAEAK